MKKLLLLLILSSCLSEEQIKESASPSLKVIETPYAYCYYFHKFQGALSCIPKPDRK